ncbi:hypothetical protein [Streptomyces violens]|uniref:hypothetical protein n=1 Tax=Streptomyces violens TaxID=66377 RepID=UPI0004C16894|nr:hypothetical protein [Streptomyces violens]
MRLAACAATVAGAWADSKILIDSTGLAIPASSVVATAIGVTAVFWLRARDGFLLPVALGVDCAGVGGAYTFHDGLLDGCRVHPEAPAVNLPNVMPEPVPWCWSCRWSGRRQRPWHPRKPGFSIGGSARRPAAAA